MGYFNSSKRAVLTDDKLKSLEFDLSLFLGVVTSGELTHEFLLRRDDPWFAALGRRCIHMTWNDRGAISRGGACGFKNVNLPPFNSLTSCGSKALFKGGKGCGSCYLVKCTSHPLCSGQTKLITITDECLYGGCADATYHFDMAGIAFGSLALPGKELALHSAGKLAVQFKRVPCDYKGRNVAFHIEKGSNPMYLAFLIEYQNGEGDLSNVELKEGSSPTWTPVKQSWGKIWRLDSSHPLQGPFSIRLTTLSGKTLVVNNAIPAEWKPNTVYESDVNFGI